MKISLHYHPLCPFSKQIIALLEELNYKHTLIREDYWRKNPAFMELSPWGEMPVMLIDEAIIVAGIYPCIEYLIDLNRDFRLFYQDLRLQTLMRQIINWFNQHFYRDVVAHILHEKLIKADLKTHYPDTQILRKAKSLLNVNMQHLNAIISSHGYLACEDLSFADIVAASHIAVLDYFHDINWQNYPKIKHWYCLIKSRPSFRSTLYEKVRGINQPPAHYLDLDF
jgi:glutathione S-transferase